MADDSAHCRRTNTAGFPYLVRTQPDSQWCQWHATSRRSALRPVRSYTPYFRSTQIILDPESEMSSI